MSQDLCFMPATDLAAAIRAKRVSAVEVTDAVLARIDRVNPVVNAFVTVAADQAREAARAADAAAMRRPRDALIVQRLKAAGAIILGKTNTPELGAGGNTKNALFGATR